MPRSVWDVLSRGSSEGPWIMFAGDKGGGEEDSRLSSEGAPQDPPPTPPGRPKDHVAPSASNLVPTGCKPEEWWSGSLLPPHPGGRGRSLDMRGQMQATQPRGLVGPSSAPCRGHGVLSQPSQQALQGPAPPGQGSVGLATYPSLGSAHSSLPQALPWEFHSSPGHHGHHLSL